MKSVPIPEARRIANDADATRLLILSIDDDGNYSFTTFGRTKAQCRAMGAWADENAVDIALRMSMETD